MVNTRFRDCNTYNIIFQNMEELSKAAPDDMGEPENATNCLRNALRFLTVLVNLGNTFVFIQKKKSYFFLNLDLNL